MSWGASWRWRRDHSLTSWGSHPLGISEPELGWDCGLQVQIVHVYPFFFFFWLMIPSVFQDFLKICPFLFVLNFPIIEKHISEFKTSQWMLLSTHSFRLSWWLRQQRICLQCGRPGTGRSAGGGHGNPLRYSCRENPNGQRSLACFAKNQTRLSD